MLKETILNYWNKTVGMVNKTLSDYPLLAYGASICRKMYRVGKALTEQYSMESNLRTLLRKLIGRVDSLASTLVRIIDVVYHKKDLMSYQYSYNFNTGSIGTNFKIELLFLHKTCSCFHFTDYVQVLPFQWYRFNEAPDIVKVAEFFTVSEINVSK